MNATTALVGDILLLVGTIVWCVIDPGWAPVLAGAALLLGMLGFGIRVNNRYHMDLAEQAARQDRWRALAPRSSAGSVLYAWASHITTWEELAAAQSECRQWRKGTAQVLRSTIRDEAAAAVFEEEPEAPLDGDLPRAIEAHSLHVRKLTWTLSEVTRPLQIRQ